MENKCVAKIVGVYAVPHTPRFVEEVRLKGESTDGRRTKSA
jgi:hypothetical protein